MNVFILIILAVFTTTGRVFLLILLAIVTGWFLSYASIKSRIFEKIYIPLTEIFESVPVISFFPIVLLIFITNIGGELGIELAVDFLVFTAVVWNIWMGEYQAFKTVPNEMVEVSENLNMNIWQKLWYVYIPFSIPRVAANLFPSVSDGYFYITVSEVFTVGTFQYHAFGIGSLLMEFYSKNELQYIFYSLLIQGITIGFVIVLLRQYSKYAVAKYTLDTDAPIIRRGRINVRTTTRIISTIARNPVSRLAGYYRQRTSYKIKKEEFEKEEKKYNIGKYFIYSISIILLILIIYGSLKLIFSVDRSTWMKLFSITPEILLYMAFDYVRVLIILLISVIMAIFIGYYLALHRIMEAIFVPIIQIFSSFPPPLYFPIIFGITYPFVYHYFGNFYTEVYVLFLGFISTFYYVFYSYWIGVKALPSEYFDIMKNLNMGILSRLRYIIIPGTFPYLIAGITSTVNSAWGGLMIGEYWPYIVGDKSLEVQNGLMKFIDVNTLNGNIAYAAWASFILAVVVAIYSIFFTKKMMDLAKKKYVAEEGIFAT
ncbi:MAG: ABC transporter permease subunit [Thermoplasmata archaeon]|jgi:NitT/TauT family transport system permease protein